MARRGYVIAFILILLIAGIGGFFGGRLLLQRLQRDFALAPAENWTPAAPEAATVSALPATASASAAPATTQPTRRPTATVLVVAAPDVTPLPAAPTESATAEPTPEPDATPVVALATFEPPGDATITPTITSASAFPYILARNVRYTTGDCPGVYILGRVTDRAGQPLTNVRLNLVDEYGNAQTAATKTAAAEAGRYDFPVFGPPRRFYLTIVDDAGRAVSERVEILHDLPPYEGQTCRWVDWRRR